MLAKTKSGEWASGRKNLRAQLMLERITGRSQDSTYQSDYMRQGIDREEAALALYQGITGRLVDTTGFLRHDTLMAGCSLDGHVGDFEGVVEAKSPIPAIHFEYLMTGKVPLDYQRQVTHILWMTGAKWCDWLSFNPEFPDKAQVKLVRIERDEAAMAQHQRDVELFLREVEIDTLAFRTKFDLPELLAEAVA